MKALLCVGAVITLCQSVIVKTLLSWSGHHVVLFGQCDSPAVSWSGQNVVLVTVGQSRSSLLCLGVVITFKLVSVKALRFVKPAKM